jgi:hypothetical protein
MLRGKLSIGVTVLSLVASVASAETLTDRMQTRRMTVLQVNREMGQFQCVEHRRWTFVAPADLRAVKPGDIVRVDRAGGTARLVLLRSAADELAGSER